MKDINSKINNLIKLGIDFNLDLLGDYNSGGLIYDLKNYVGFSGLEYWLLLREMGHSCTYFENKCQNKGYYASNVSTITYVEYFFYNKLSYIFEELKRITYGQFVFEIIDEFEPMFDKENNEINDIYGLCFKEGRELMYSCKYKINNKYFEFDYKFMPHASAELSEFFVQELLISLEDIFKQLKISFIQDDFLTFFIGSKELTRFLINEKKICVNRVFKRYLTFQENNKIKNKLESDPNTNESNHSTNLEKEDLIKNKNLGKTNKDQIQKWWEFWK